MSRCAVPGCTRLVHRHKLMCLAHWRLVPADLRAELHRTWRSRRATMSEGLRHQHAEAVQAHQEAKERAIRSVL